MDLFDSVFNGMPGINMYRGWVVPDLYPGERRPVLTNWPADEIWAYCGGR